MESTKVVQFQYLDQWETTPTNIKKETDKNCPPTVLAFQIPIQKEIVKYQILFFLFFDNRKHQIEFNNPL